MIYGNFSTYKKYPLYHYGTIRLLSLSNGYIALIFREDMPLLFDWLKEDLSRLKMLPIVFKTPETNYHVEYIHKDTEVTNWFNREVIHCPQMCFLDSDALTIIDLHHGWEQLVHEAKEKASKEKR